MGVRIMKDIIKFSVNHWSSDDFPPEEPFLLWMTDSELNHYLGNLEYVKKHKLVVVTTLMDMSVSFAVTAPLEFVEKECPCLLRPENQEFVYDKNANRGIYDIRFKDYSEENIGLWYYDMLEDEFERYYDPNDDKTGEEV